MKFWGYLKVFLIIFVILFIVSCNGGEPTSSEPHSELIVMASEVEVEITHEDISELLEKGTIKDLFESDQIIVRDTGRALLAIADAVIVEMIDNGNIVVQEATVDEQTLLLTLALNSGAVLNDLNVDDLIEARLSIESEYASVKATGTKFMVVREENTPLEWIVAFESGENDLTITGADGQEVISSGQAVWVAPDGPPGPVVEANISAISAWVTEERDSEAPTDLGEVVWAPAAVTVNSSDLPENMPTGAPVTVHEIELYLNPSGFYQWADCNGDGEFDLYSENGRYQFDLTQVIGQKRAIDVKIVNGNPLVDTILTGSNPANEIIPGAVNAASGVEGAQETLSLRSEVQPFHFAELVIEDGCFVGMALVPPSQPIAQPPTIIPTHTPTVTPTSTLTPTPTIEVCQPSPLPGWVLYPVQAGDTLSNIGQRTGLTVAAIQQVNCLVTDRINIGQTLWLPFIPPTFTPVCSDLNFSATLGYGPYENRTINLDTIDFPANVALNVWVARADGSGMAILGTIETGRGDSFSTTFELPYEYESQPSLMIGIDSTRPCYTGNRIVNLPNNPLPIYIYDVVIDQSVTILTEDFPPDTNFTVTMGPIGTKGINGYYVGTINSGDGGSFYATFNIPDQLKGSPEIAIRLESPEGYYSFNWFTNVPTEPCNYTFQITDVAPDYYVSITTYGIPADQEFDVFMYDKDPYSDGEHYYADSFYSKGGGHMEIGSLIPSELYGVESISVILASSQECTAGNWFYNYNPGTGGYPPPNPIVGETTTNTPTPTITTTSTPTETPTPTPTQTLTPPPTSTSTPITPTA